MKREVANVHPTDQSQDSTVGNRMRRIRRRCDPRRLRRSNSMSWHANTTKTVEDGVTVTSEGTAVFATGEKAHVVLKGVAGPKAAWYYGTATVDSVYQFDDGASFTLQYVQIWDGLRSLAAGLFGEGTGRFAGIKGSGTASGGAPSGPMSWTGMYELPKR